ncbi:MAG: DNA-directed RNA polymerase subunit delta [Solobacterium sp.]|nr:DNA-directed RNA polymerase subunit delta [Solobacterium sp.]
MSYNQTMTDVAYNCLSAQKMEMEFLKLWNEVAAIMEIPEEKQRRKKSQFYSELMLDNRFASFPENKWDLRNRRKFEEVHIDTSEIELEDDEEEEQLEESGWDVPSGEDAY